MTSHLNISASITAPFPRDAFVMTMGRLPNSYEKPEAQDSFLSVFQEQIEQWKDDTRHLSSVTKMIAHPSYLRIIGLARQSTGTAIERLLLCELEKEPDYWFDALAAITGVNPVNPEDDFDQSVGAWLKWGREKGIISR